MWPVDATLQALTLGVVAYTILTYRLLSVQTRQGFENKFFQLLRFHHDIVNAIQEQRPIMPPGQPIVSGRSAFHELYKWFVDQYLAEYNKCLGPLPADQLADQAYTSFYEMHQDSLGHYFRNLCHPIKFIDRSNVGAKDKEFYAHLVRAQMSSDELLLLFYNCHASSLGRTKFHPLVEKYALLENMSQDDLVSRRLKLSASADHKSFYRPRAYGES
ncbi:MAG: putative phage abortive infection protein [Terriglobia bacterium]